MRTCRTTTAMSLGRISRPDEIGDLLRRQFGFGALAGGEEEVNPFGLRGCRRRLRTRSVAHEVPLEVGHSRGLVGLVRGATSTTCAALASHQAISAGVTRLTHRERS